MAIQLCIMLSRHIQAPLFLERYRRRLFACKRNGDGDHFCVNLFLLICLSGSDGQHRNSVVFPIPWGWLVPAAARGGLALLHDLCGGLRSGEALLGLGRGWRRGRGFRALGLRLGFGLRQPLLNPARQFLLTLELNDGVVLGDPGRGMASDLGGLDGAAADLLPRGDCSVF